MNNSKLTKISAMKDLGNSPDLPKGAIKCTDEQILRPLQKVWAQEIQMYHDTDGHCIKLDRSIFGGYATEESGDGSNIFAYHLHPEVEGYAWYRGFAININDGKILIFFGWIQPWCGYGGNPDPIVYLLGDVSRDTLLKVIQACCASIQDQIRLSNIQNKFMDDKLYHLIKKLDQNVEQLLELFRNR